MNRNLLFKTAVFREDPKGCGTDIDVTTAAEETGKGACFGVNKVDISNIVLKEKQRIGRNKNMYI